MNIEKLAKRLKEFTLDEIEMIAEADIETELEQLLNEGKIAFEQGRYKYVEKDANIDFVLLEQNDSELVKQIIQNFIEVLENIEKQYPKHLKLKIAKI